MKKDAIEKDKQDKKGNYLKENQQLNTLSGVSIYVLLRFVSYNKSVPHY